MRIHLISPTHYLRDGSLHKTTRYWTSAITLPYHEGAHPSPRRVDFTDELMSDLDLARVGGTWRSTAPDESLAHAAAVVAGAGPHRTVAMLVANAKMHRYLRRNPVAWGTIS